MSDPWLFVLTFGTMLGCALIAGVFFAFSTFVMKGLGGISPPHGIAAMQSINVTAVSPAFMAALFGTAAGCLVLALSSLFTWRGPQSLYLLGGAVLYLAGTIIVTVVFNVPRNDALAAVDSTSTEGARVWADYLVTWTTWNHVRTVAALAAAAALTMALHSMTAG